MKSIYVKHENTKPHADQMRVEEEEDRLTNIDMQTKYY